MTRVFVSHCAEDNYFVDFLIELLKHHHIEVWVDRNDLAPGRDFPSDIEQALAICDSMIVVLSRHSSGSQWMAREVVHFKAVNPDKAVIPLVLDAEADPDKVYDGFGMVTQLRCYESYLESLRKLLQMLGRTLFPEVNRRKVSDRRSSDRRHNTGDRRKNSTKRMRMALDDYMEATERDLIEPIKRMRDLRRMVDDLLADDSPLHSFSFEDRKTGEQVNIGLSWLQRTAVKSWRTAQRASRAGWGDLLVSRTAPAEEEIDLTGAGYILDDIIDELEKTYVITSKDRRTADRRNNIVRRRDDALFGCIEISVRRQQDSLAPIFAPGARHPADCRARSRRTSSRHRCAGTLRRASR